MHAAATDSVGERASSSPVVLSVSRLGHNYGERTALEAFSLDVRAGEVIGLLGPNGSGKSTVLALLTGLVPLKTGTMSWDGARVRPGDAILRRELGVVFQSAALDSRLSIRENLELAATLRGYFGHVAKQRVAEGLDFVGLGDRQRDVVGTLSGGQRRRVDIARALIHRPRLLLLDEPSAGLDEASFRDLWARLLAQRASAGLAIVVATHRPDEAALCSRLTVLVRGKTVLETTPADLQRLVTDDIVTLTSTEPAACAAVVRTLYPAAAVDIVERDVVLRVERGHECIPALVDALRGGPTVTAISLRRPSLSDAFIKATGEGLGAAQ